MKRALLRSSSSVTSRAWIYWRAVPIVCGLVLALLFVAQASALPNFLVTKVDALIGGDGDGRADPGETIEYTVTLQNTGADPATGVTYNDTIDPNTTLIPGSVNASPLARDDSYETIGNTLLEVGVTASGNPAVIVAGSLLDNDSEFLGDTFVIASVENDLSPVFSAMTEQGGVVTVQTNGTFTYTPPAGFTGTDNFDYVISDNGAVGSGPLTSAGRVTINVVQRVWYVRNNALANGLGRSGDPFDTLAEAQTISAANDTIYIFAGDGTTTGQNAGILLKDGQRLIGEGVALTIPIGLVQQGVNGPNPTSLRAAGAHPRIGNTVGNGISVSNDVPSEIRGLSISGSTNAIDLAIADASTGTLNIKDNIIFGATNDEGIDINYGGSGLLTLDVQNNTWNTSSPTHDGTAFDVNATATGNLALNFSNNTNILSTGGNGIVLVDAGGAGVLTVTGFANNTFHGDTVGTGVNANTVIFDATPGGSFDLVSGGATTVGATGNGMGGSGMMLINVSGNLSFTDLDIVASGGTGLSATSGVAYTGSAGFRLAVGAGVATVDATNGPAVTMSIVDVSLPFVDVDSTSSVGTGVSLASVTGTFSAGSGSSITNASTTDFVVSNSNATITYSGSITDAAGPGVSLSTNTGSVITFNGPLSISSGASTAFSAVGGGTVSATDNTSTLTSTSATALNVANTTIGASNLIFRSISSNGGSATAIILDTTGSTGGLQVLGDGSNTSFGGNGSGGTITNKSGSDGSNTTGVGIYLNSTSNVVLRRMNLSNFNNFAIRGLNVNNFILEYCTINHSSGKIGDSDANNEGAVAFGTENPSGTNGLTGTATVTSCLIEDGFENNFKIANLSGTLSQFTMTGSTVRDNSNVSPGNNGLEFRVQGTANVTADITTSTFTGNRANGIQVSTTTEHTGTVDVEVGVAGTPGSGGTFTNNNIGVNIAHGSAGTLNFDVHRGTYNSSPGLASPININLAAGGGGPMSGLITSNTITNANSATGPGIRVITNGTDADGSNVLTIQISNNNISQVGNRGIEMIARDGNSDINATVTNNIVQLTDPLSADGIRIDAGVTATDTTSICADISGNDADTVGTNGIRLRNRFAGTTFRLPSYGGAATDSDGTHDAVIAHLSGLNPLSSNISADHAVGNTGFTPGGIACATPAAFDPISPETFAQSPTDPSPAAQFNTPLIDQANVKFTAYTATSVRAKPTSRTPDYIQSRVLASLLPPVRPMASGETINVSIGTLPTGESVTIKFQVTVDNPLPLGTTQISNQGTVSSNELGPVLTDDPDVVGANDPTITLVDRPDTTVISLTRQSANPNRNASVTWQVVFADSIDGLTPANFTLVNTGLGGTPAIGSVTESSGPPSTTWNISASTGTGDGTLELRMANDTSLSHDVTNLPYTEPASGAVYTIDRTAPTVTNVAASTSGCLGAGPEFCNVPDVVTIQITFSEVINVSGAPLLTLETGATNRDATVTGGGNTTTLTFDYTVQAGDTATDLDYASISALALNGGTIQDIAGNSAILTLATPGTAGSLGANEAIIIDTSAPTVTSFTRETPATSPTNADTLFFRATFSEQVMGVGTADFDATGTSATISSIGAIAPFGPFTVEVSGGDLATYNGVVSLDFSPGMDITDRAGNPLANSEPATDETYTLDNTAPTVTINQAASQTDPTNTGPINFTVIFSEPVSDFDDVADVTLSAGTAPGTLTALITGGPTTYNVAISGMTGNGTVVASIPAGAATDGLNTSVASTSTDNTVSYDATVPTVTINQAGAQADPTGTSPINVTVIFSEPVSDFDDLADVTLSGSAGATTAVISGGPTTYNIAISGMASDGTVIASIPAGAASDGANLSAASTSTDNSVLYDTVAPSVTINQAVGQADPTSASPINFTVIFSEDVTDFDDIADVTLSGTGGATTAVITGGPRIYTIAVSGMSTSGTVIADVPAGVALDLAAQPNGASTSSDNTVTYIPPTDLSITKTDGVATATPGGSVTYTITASNAGPNADPAAIVADTFPASLTATWTCVGAGGGTCTAAGSGNINDTVNLPVGGSVTYTANATVSASATGTLANTATVSSSIADTNTANNSATDTDTLTPQADLAITKTDGVTTAVPGGSVTYTITASNAGPSNAPSATVADTFPAILTATWTCVGAGGGTCTAAGSGNINDTINLPAGGSVTYTVNATINASATGSLSNTATVSSATTDPNPGNNSATDTDILTPQADLAITKTDGVTIAVPGGSVTYTITASNVGPSNAPSATVADTFPAILTATWTCVGAGGGTCTVAGSGNINDTVNLPAGGSVTYTVNATVSAAATGSLSNTATVTASGGVTDPIPANNSATDTDTLVPLVDVTINQAAGQSDPTNASPSNFTVVFASAVTDFDDPSDVTLSGTAGATTVTITGGPTIYTVAVSGMTGDGTVIASIAAGAAAGTQGEPNAASTSTDNTVTYDATAPDTTIVPPVPTSPTNTTSPNFSFSGDDGTGVGGLTFACSLDGAGFTTCTSPQSYTGLSDGSHTFQVRAIDAAGNSDGTPASFTWTIDTAAPTVAFSSAAPDPTNVSPIPVTVTFSESVTGFIAADITTGNGTVNNFAGSGSVYTFDLVPAGQGLVTADIAAGVAQDSAGNNNTAAIQFSRAYDSVAPTVTINQAAGQSDPASTAPINFTAVFNEPVTGFGDSAADVTISGTAGASTATVTGSGTTYTIAVSGMTSVGTVIVALPAGAAQDLATNPSAASTSTDNTVTFAPAAPIVTGIVRSDPDPTNATTVDYTVTFSTAVTGVDTGDFNLASTSITGAAVIAVAGSGTTYTITVDTGTGSGTLGLNLVDNDTIIDIFGSQLGGVGAGNGNLTGAIYTIDKTAPTAGSLVTPAAQNGSTTYSFTVVLSDNLAIDITSLSGSDIRVIGPGGYNQLATLVSVNPATNGSPRTATYQIIPPGGSWNTPDGGTYTFTLEANQVFDTVGNPAAATSLGSTEINLIYTTYLPLVVREGAPDLVASISLSPNQRAFAAGEPVTISVTITNQGSATAAPFWVDLYINPSSPPTAANQLWNTRCGLTPCFGMAWASTGGLAPGQSITFSSQSPLANYSIWPGWLAAGTTDLYAYVDSFNPGVVTGAVAESNEANNRAELHGLAVTGANPTILQPQSAANVLPRPVLTSR